MNLLRSAFIIALGLGSTQVLAEQLTCESHGGRTETCGSVRAGSSITMIDQISSSPCIEGRTWGADNGSIWVSDGCRAVFDVQPRYSSTTYYDDDSYGRERYSSGRSYASDDSGRQHAVNACVNRVGTDQPFDFDEIGTNDVRRVSDDLFVVELSTPKGPVSCSVDRTGDVRNVQYR
jgi:hypothetical protein